MHHLQAPHFIFRCCSCPVLVRSIHTWQTPHQTGNGLNPPRILTCDGTGSAQGENAVLERWHAKGVATVLFQEHTSLHQDTADLRLEHCRTLSVHRHTTGLNAKAKTVADEAADLERWRAPRRSCSALPARSARGVRSLVMMCSTMLLSSALPADSTCLVAQTCWCQVYHRLCVSLGSCSNPSWDMFCRKGAPASRRGLVWE